jgi:hypothetical protein
MSQNTRKSLYEQLGTSRHHCIIEFEFEAGQQAPPRVVHVSTLLETCGNLQRLAIATSIAPGLETPHAKA